MATDTVAQALHDPAAYPLLVMDAGAYGGPRSGSTDDPAGLVDGALRAVLGARTRVDDASGIRAALARSFVRSEVDGRRTYRNVPTGSVMDTVDEGELSGFQATLLSRARDVVVQGLPLLDGLRSLTPTSDPEDAKALASVVRTAVERLRDEFARRDGPRSVLVDEQLRILLGDPASAVLDPDLVKGSLGALRDRLGLTSGPGGFANTADDEQQLTSFRLLVEYVGGLRQSWSTAAPAFGAGPGSSRAFVSARLRRLDLTMQTIAEAVDRVRSQLDSVYVGEAERRTQPLMLPSRPTDRLTVEDLLEWADDVVAPDVAAALRDGGRIVISSSVLPNALRVRDLLQEAAGTPLAGSLGAPRVRVALNELATQFDGLVVELEQLTGGVASGSGMPGGGAGGALVEVPDVTGAKLKAARKAVRRAGLTPVLGDAMTADDGRVDTVRAIDPPPGTTVRRGAEVRLGYLAALTRTEVPDVVGQALRPATERLDAGRLEVGQITLQRSTTHRPGSVVATSPPVGTVLAARSTVDLTVATGDPGDLYEALCGLVPLVGAAGREGWEGVTRLWQAAVDDDPDCPVELKSSARTVGVLADVIRTSIGGRGGAGAFTASPTVAREVQRAAAAVVQMIADLRQDLAGVPGAAAAGPGAGPAAGAGSSAGGAPPAAATRRTPAGGPRPGTGGKTSTQGTGTSR